MGWRAKDKTGKEKSEIILCIGLEVPKDPWRAGRDVGLQMCSAGFVLRGSLHTTHRAPTTKAADTYSPAAANEATHYSAARQQRWG